MNKIKQQFSELRKSTPKAVQWLLLIAAFVLVIILLTLLLTNKEDSDVSEISSSDVPLKLIMSPESVNWAETKVGENRNQTVKVYASAPVKIMAIRITKEVNGFPTPLNSCTQMAFIDDKTACKIVLDYNPTKPFTTEPVALYIDWRGVDEPEKMKKTNKIVIVLGAVADEENNTEEKQTEQKIEQKVENKTEPVIEEKEEVVIKEEPVKESFKEEIASIALPDPLERQFTPQPVYIEGYTEEEEEKTPAISCSDFAFPGYNSSGTQIGWIRPEAGAYYFHPFSDKDCNNPTGVYNPDNGIITDINDSGKKIGTDAEHIGYTTITNGTIPQLSNPKSQANVNKARQLTDAELGITNATPDTATSSAGGGFAVITQETQGEEIVGTSGNATYSSDPYDRTFVLRQYKPIPATIVSEVRADPSVYKQGEKSMPVRATVDRNVYADNGRTVIIPAGTLMLGYLTGTLPGPYTSIGRMEINWYQFILPNGVEFNFNSGSDPFSADSQGRIGVPGRGSTDYLEQFVMPMLTAIVPAAVNMIAPVADTFVNQIDLDNNTVVQSGTIRSSELAKNEIINAWNQVAQKLIVDMMDNTVPPFSIAAGTRITVYSPTDLVVTCGVGNGKKCSISQAQADSIASMRNKRNDNWANQAVPNYADGSWTGQVRSFNLEQFCDLSTDTKLKTSVNGMTVEEAIREAGLDYRTVLFYCQSSQYEAINNARQDAYYQNQQQQFQTNYDTSTSTGLQSYNEDILGLTYDDSGAILNPFTQTTETVTEEAAPVITCEDGALPDEYGCCPGEIYTDMGEQGFNCCPETGGDCFPPIL